MMIGQLKRENLAEQIAQALIDYIESENLEPGDPIPSSGELAENFGVSRSVVREAFKLLEARDIINVVNGKRATVKPISSDLLFGFFQRIAKTDSSGFRAILEVREGIELQNAKLAAQRRLPEEMARMKEIVHEMRQNLYNMESFIDLDVQLHILIAKASQNVVLAHLTESLRETLKLTMMEGRIRRINSDEIDQIQELHEQLIAAIEQSDPAAAVLVMQQHFEEQRHYLVENSVPQK